MHITLASFASHTSGRMRICNEWRHHGAISSSRLSRRMRIAAAAVSAIAIAATHTAVATNPSAVASGSCAAREYLWASSVLALVVASCAAGYSVWSKQQRSQQRLQQRDRDRKSWRSALLWVACASSVGWGGAGVALSTDDDCARRFNADDERWVVTLAAVVASASLVAALALLVAAAFASVHASAPGKEAPPAIVCLRCSCCSAVMKRAALFTPMALLTAVNFVSWRESVTLEREPPSPPALHCDDTTAATTFFGGAALLFASVVLAQLMSVYCRCRTRSGTAASPRSAPLTTRRRQRLAVFIGLLVLSFASIAWAIFGWLSMTRSSSSPCTAPLQSSSLLRRSMAVSIALLLLLGWVLLTLTLCCRLEDFIVTSSELPSVDLAVLSPKLCGSPKRFGPETASDDSAQAHVRTGPLATTDTAV